jgi:HAD superfamily hydrolase (TIGR01509 family)
MESDLVVFLDDGGVMNEPESRHAQWTRLVAEFFALRLGGSLEAWAKANRIVNGSLSSSAAWDERVRAAPDHASFYRAYHIDWLGGMCDLVGVPRPVDDVAASLAHTATRSICQSVRSAFPGAVEAIRALHARGYRLFTASGEPSWELEGYLEGMGVRDCFERLYGPDLIATFKSGPLYYELVLADAGISPESALIVDDSPRAIAWAASVGARTVLVGPPNGSLVTAGIQSLAELPQLLDRLDRPRY